MTHNDMNNDLAQDVSFFAIPTTALRGMYDELRLSLDEKDASAAMYRYGRRTGEGYATVLGLESSGVVEAAELLTGLVAEVGLGRCEVFTEPPRVFLVFTDSAEKTAMRGATAKTCNFTMGAAAGFMSALTGVRYEAREHVSPPNSFHIKGGFDVIIELYPEETETFEQEMQGKRGGKMEESVEPGASGGEAGALHGLERGEVYLIETEDVGPVYRFFSFLSRNFPALCFTRDFPKKLVKKYGILGKIVWLSTSDTKGSLEPSNLSALFYEFQRFVGREKEPVALLSGVEYLVTHNGFLPVLKLIHLLTEQTALHDAITILPVHPEAFEPKERANIERETSLLTADDVEKLLAINT